MIKTFLLLALILMPTFAWCFQDEVAEWTEMNISYKSGEKIAIAQENLKIKSLALMWEGKEIEIPREELEGISFPFSNTLYLSYSTFHFGELNGVPYKVIHFRYGLEKDESFEEFPEVSFIFYKGAYQERDVRRKVSADSWQHEVKKRGKPVQTGGTEQQLR
ncbi:hypothetical protein [Geobacter hydrogenophilus]|uniref:Lipoprotein n=2 Tax=Geobacter hydrogenophilus TaxID=40983 RepID=A0A9W6FYQ8_9BACT|nr:hypothetical protein [Geobacter hydrogenophilus]GLI37282.1 hypothetical protein GHYDROH2_07830 [Geobacter hydrogenophilus]